MTPILAKIEHLTIGESFNVSLLGMAIVFFVLVGLLAMICFLRFTMGKLETAGGAKTAGSNRAASEKQQAEPFAGMVPAKGSAGEIKLYNVNDKTAALVMAIVANKMEAPLNELRFISIREKTQSVNESGSPKATTKQI